MSNKHTPELLKAAKIGLERIKEFRDIMILSGGIKSVDTLSLNIKTIQVAIDKATGESND